VIIFGRSCQIRHIRPFANSVPIGLNVPVRIEKFLLTPRLDPEPNDIESSHRVTSLDVGRSARCARGIMVASLADPSTISVSIAFWRQLRI
jgi:hypothetical protein